MQTNNMREIKFRAWDKQNEEMIDVGTLCMFTDGSVMVNEDMPTHFQQVELLVLIQYTGLKDKNGVEIYEGDIVMHEKWNGETGRVDSPLMYEVCWSGDFAGFRMYGEGNDGTEDVVSTGMSGDEFRVIGNIYENPELLTDK